MWNNFLLQRGFSESIIKENKIEYIYPWLRIPYLNEDLETIKGRWLGTDGQQRPNTIPKYMWLRGKPTFPFNWKPIGWDTFIYICEGELDTLLLKSSMQFNKGNPDNVFGIPFGASTFKDEWAEVLKKSDVKVFSLLDNDPAGEKGAQNIANKIGRDVEQIVWPSTTIGFDLTDFANGNYTDLVKRIGAGVFKTIKTVNQDLLVFKKRKLNLTEDVTLEDLKTNIPIEDVISRVSTAKMKAIPLGYQVNCPFHDDKTASLIIYKQTNSFYCFSCGAGGSSLDFLIKINGDFNLSKAVDFLKNNYVRK